MTFFMQPLFAVCGQLNQTFLLRHGSFEEMLPSLKCVHFCEKVFLYRYMCNDMAVMSCPFYFTAVALSG